MNLQTLILWTARLACPLAMGLMIWWMLRGNHQEQKSAQTPGQPVHALHQRQSALDAEIHALEAKLAGKETMAQIPAPDTETPAA
jgi:hypothetical protein